jgi:hypothetical protein
LFTVALLLGAVASPAIHSQPPGYGAPPPRQQDYRYDDYRDGYDDRYSPRGEVGFFYDELSPYGDWVRTRDYGWAWFPRDVHPYWRPYSDGRWVNTEYGWTWVSYEPFGWATYHYGRWAWDARFGWLWVPGTTWGPAWVSWQHGGGYVGWAPLPPSVGFEIGIGIRLGGIDLSFGIRPDSYSFVPERSFLESRLSGHLIPTARNVTIIRQTTNITNYTYVDNRVMNRGVDVRRIEQVTGRRTQRLRVVEARDRHRSEIAANEVRIYRPERQKLDSVRVGPRVDVGERVGSPPANRGEGQPSRMQRGPAEIEVAPRVSRAPRADPREVEKREQRERQELERYQAEAERQIDKVHQRELARARENADRLQVEKRHKAEIEELRTEKRLAAEQLAERQKAKRLAANAPPPTTRANPRGDRKPDDDRKPGNNRKPDDDRKPGNDRKPDDDRKEQELR